MGERSRRDGALSYGEQWLERELLSLQYRADQGYPEPASDRLSRSPARSGTLVADAGVIHRGEREAPVLAAAPLRATAVRPEPRGLRRLLPGAATLAVLVGMWAGLGALSAARHQPVVVLAGSVKTASGYVYVAKPGDTLWSIASRLEPGGDPRPLVARLEGELHGRTLVPGSRLVLP